MEKAVHKKKLLIKMIPLAFLIAILTFLGVGFYFWINLSLPKLVTPKDYHPYLVTEIYAQDGEKIGEFFKERRFLIPLDKVPKHVVHAFIASEDIHFFEHSGIDLKGTLRAFFKNLRAGKIIQGGSTITQQVARSLMLSPERTITRKIKEALLAMKLESRLKKEEILSLYLNQIYLGSGAYGIEAAARTYFNKRTRELTLAEAALLAGLPRAPSRYSPLQNQELAHERQLYVLRQMKEGGFITAEEESIAKRQEIFLEKNYRGYEDIAPYFISHIRNFLIEKFGFDTVYEKGLKVYSTLDSTLQKEANASLDKGLRDLDKRQGYRGPSRKIALKDLELDHSRIHQLQVEKRVLPVRIFGDGEEGEEGLSKEFSHTPLAVGEISEGIIIKRDDNHAAYHVRVGKMLGVLPFQNLFGNPTLHVGDLILVKVLELSQSKEEWPLFSLEQTPEVQGALLSFDLNGKILVMVGGRDFHESEFNRATQALRQSGSTFKPIIYAAALDNGFTLASVIQDSPIVYGDEEADFDWKPHNFQDRFYGDTLLRTALINSRNVPTIKIAEAVTIKKISDLARTLGIVSPLNLDLSMALGSSSVSLYELSLVYGVFAKNGKKVIPYGIEKIESSEGVVLYENEMKEGEQVLSPQTAFLMTTLLQDVVLHGTGRGVSSLKRITAGKTGTTNDYTDAWFIGFTPHVITGVWVGFDNLRSLGAGETGARAAAPIWLDYMQEASQRYPHEPFEIPEGIVFAYVDNTTGTLAFTPGRNTIKAAFKVGTEPVLQTVTQKKERVFFKEELLFDSE